MGAVDALILNARMLWDGDAANRGMDEASGKAGKLQATLSSAFKKVGLAIAGAFTVDAIVNFGKDCIEAGAEVSAEVSAFNQIMGDYTDEANAKMQSVADETGMVASRLTPYMTSMTAKFKGLGYGIDDATTMASDGLTLAADASAFWDMSLDESMSHLNSFINGSYEGGEAIGLFANDTQMAAYAVEQGLVKDTKAWASLDEATKQATRLEYAQNMMAQSGATGQAAKESGAYANVMANLAEKWRQFKAQIGEPLIQNIVIPVMQKLGNIVGFLSDKFSDISEVWREGVGGVLSTRVVPALRNVFGALGSMVPKVKTGKSAWQIFLDVMYTLETWLLKAANGLNKLAEILPSLAPYIAAAAAAFAGFKIGGVIQGLVTGFQKARLAVTLFAGSQGSAQIATGLASGALKAHEIVVGLLTGKIKLAQVATALWSKVQTAFNAVMTANPIGLVVAAIAAIVAAIVIAYKKSDTFRAFVDKLWASLKEKLQPVIQTISEFISGKLVPAFQAVAGWITGTVVPALQSMGSWLKDHILSAIQAVAGWITGTLIPTFQQWGEWIQTNIVPALQELGAAIADRVQPILAAISDFVTNYVVPAFSWIVEAVRNILTQAAPILDAIKIGFETAWTNIKIVAEAVWSQIKNAVNTALSVIRGIIQAITAVIRGDWSGAWSAIKDVASSIWSGIRNAVSIAINAVKGVISNTLSGIRAAWSTAWTTVKTVASNIWTGIRDTISDKIEAAKTKVSNIVDNIKIKIKGGFNEAKSTVVSVWNGIKNTIRDKIEEAKQKVSDAIDKVKGFLGFKNFSWSLPKPKLPHFSVSGGEAPWGFMGKGTLPKVSIEWYRKAMNEAMVLTKPTIFGATDQGLLGGGEAGNEVVSGEDRLIGLISNAVATNNAAMLDVLARMLAVLQNIDETLYDRIVDALTDGVKLKMDGREFGRLVKSYA